MDPSNENIILKMQLKALDKRREEIVAHIKLNEELIESYKIKKNNEANDLISLDDNFGTVKK